MKTPEKLCVLMVFLIGASLHAAEKTLIDYFLPMSIQSPLVSSVWGAPGVFPRGKVGTKVGTVTYFYIAAIHSITLFYENDFSIYLHIAS